MNILNECIGILGISGTRLQKGGGARVGVAANGMCVDNS